MPKEKTFISFIAIQERIRHLKILIKFKGKAVWKQGVTFCRTAGQGTSQLCSIPCFTLINCSYHWSSNFTACFLLGLSHSYASYRWELPILTLSASQNHLQWSQFPQFLVVVTISFVELVHVVHSTVSPDTCKLKSGWLLSLAAYFHML